MCVDTYRYMYLCIFNQFVSRISSSATEITASGFHEMHSLCPGFVGGGGFEGSEAGRKLRQFPITERQISDSSISHHRLYTIINCPT